MLIFWKRKRAKKPRIKRNRRNKLYDSNKHVYSTPLGFACVLSVAVMTCVALALHKHNYDNIVKQIAQEEVRERTLFEQYEREKTRWEKMTAPKQLRRELERNSISMNAAPSPLQVVLMGAPVPSEYNRTPRSAENKPKVASR